MFFSWKLIHIVSGIAGFLTFSILNESTKENPTTVATITALFIYLALVGLGFILQSAERFIRKLIDSKKSTNKASDTEKPKALTPKPRATKDITLSDINLRPGAIDHIQFTYKTQDLRINTYTLSVTHFSSDKMTGYCYERKAQRSFFPENIVNLEVVRVTTGEVLTVNQWLHEQGLELVESESATFSNIHDFLDHAQKWESEDITIKHTLSPVSHYGTVGLFKKFKSGKPHKHPFLYLEARNSVRGFLVSGKCKGKSYSELDSAVDYFEEVAEKLIEEVEH